MSDIFDFESELADFDEMDSMILQLGKMINEDEAKTSMMNPHVLQKIQYVYKALKLLLKDSGAKVTYKVNEPFKSMGVVSVTAKNIQVNDTARFINIARFASNYEAYPKTDGTIQINFAFHGLTFPIES